MSGLFHTTAGRRSTVWLNAACVWARRWGAPAGRATAATLPWAAKHPSLVAVSVAATAFVIITDISELLAAVEQRNNSSFSASVLTQPRLRPWDETALAAAFKLWRAAETSHSLPVSTWVAWHTLADFFFIASYAILLCRGFNRVRDHTRSAGRTARREFLLIALPVAADLLETTITLVVARGRYEALVWFEAIQWLTALKWITLAAVIATMAALFANPRVEGDVGLRNAQCALARQDPRAAITPLVVLTAIFAALVALPGGGPLEQLPDVIRAQLADWPRLLGASFALALLMASVMTASWRATAVIQSRLPAPKPARLAIILGASAFVVCGAASIANDDLTLSPAAPALLFLGLSTVAALRQWVTQPPRPSSNTQTSQPSHPQDCTATPAATTAVTPCLAETPPGGGRAADGEAAPAQARKNLAPNATDVPATLVGFVMLVGALGLVRAAVRPTLLEQRYFVAFWVGVSGAVFGPVLVVWLASTARRWRDRRSLHPAQQAFVVVCIGGYGLLAVTPQAGRHIGTNGVVAVSFAAFALALGELTYRSRAREPWLATRQLGLGKRTPWIALLIASWLLAGVIDAAGGYHEVREAAFKSTPTTSLPDAAAAYTDLASAVRAWKQQATDNAQCRGAQGQTPLLMVAAPGGGIRAAYWTASVLEKLEALSPCGRGNIFMISGVSGGSVGAAVWLSADAAVSARQQARQLGHDRALAGTIAALLTRDLAQPLTGMRRAWADRAAVQASLWVESTKYNALADPWPFASDDGNARARLDSPWPQFGPHAWDPVVVLNAASVTDGCRVLVANVGKMPAAGGACGYAQERTPGAATGGPVTAAVGAFTPGESYCADATQTPGVAMAALTSARFPVVSPSAAIRQCDPLGAGQLRITYAVDGGYFENTGLLTLLQVWEEIEPHIDLTTTTPWVILADNSYRSSASQGTPPRPRELLIPLRTKGANKALSAAALEQMAGLAMRETSAPPPRYVRLGPRLEPSVTAPLGWVLSKDSIRSLDAQLDAAVAADDPAGDRAWLRLRADLCPDDATDGRRCD